ncbi:molybdopterin-dependent oxidoreductase [Gilvimarinus sp. F26214L]|uniref:molybdopterin-dependent oxidoreductase n=1 Tax=Gilvimarinus sp. DZF01 TaxID=3461371 RepID=UPI0040463BE5
MSVATGNPRVSDPVTIKTTCPYCGVGCGITATHLPGAEQPLQLQGDPVHPANLGRLCVKGAALGETIELEGRLLRPLIREKNEAARSVSWDESLSRIADGIQRVIDRHGREAVAFYVSGQLLTEDYYVANKFVKGWLGTANIDTNSRLCMSSAVAGHKRAFGEDIVPGNYEDLEQADLVVLVGSNTAWCHPVIHQRILQARCDDPRKRIVVIDPRRTATCEQADLHLSIAAGSDVWLFNGLLAYLHDHGEVDAEFVETSTRGAEEALRVAREHTKDIEGVAAACQLPADQVQEFYSLFARTRKVVTVFSQGVNQSSSGTDKVNSIINCHLLSGRMGKSGMGPFSITGQPNAMGGREVGGLANTLAAHLHLESPAHRKLVQDFWGSPRMAERPGLTAVELFEAIHQGRIRALWIMATNPVVSLPDADRVQNALQKLDLLVVSDLFANTDTARHAHVVLPALGWGEKDGTVTNSERRISRQRAFLPAPGQARPDWWAVCRVAQRLGCAGFDYRDAHEIFSEHASLSAWRNRPGQVPRAFNLAGLARLDRSAYDALEPCQWPLSEESGDSARLFENGVFFHPDGRARLVPTPPREPANPPDHEYPLVLNTGRVRNHWHTMTRTGRSARLCAHLPEPFVDMHPYEAMLHGVQGGHLVRVESRWGNMVARLRCTADQPRGAVFIPIHWTDQVASDGRVGALVNPVVDPVSGEPEFKHTPVRVTPFPVDWHAVMLTRWPLRAGSELLPAYWTRIQGSGFLRYELAGREALEDPRDWCRTLLGLGEEVLWWDVRETGSGRYRAAGVIDDRLQVGFFLSPRADLPDRHWLEDLFGQGQLSEADWAGLKLGCPPAGSTIGAGATVCSCFSVNRNAIIEAVREAGLDSVEAVGRALGAGTNCGSCQPEIRQLIERARYPEDA